LGLRDHPVTSGVFGATATHPKNIETLSKAHSLAIKIADDTDFYAEADASALCRGGVSPAYQLALWSTP